MNPISRQLKAIASGLTDLGSDQAADVEDAQRKWEAHAEAIRASDPPGIDLPSCFDCCNFECGGITDAPFCKVSEQVDVRRFFLSSGSKRKDVRQCPGFREDR